MRRFGLDDIVTFIVAAEDVAHVKPHAEPLDKTLAHFGFRPDEAVVGVDTNFDILMGRNAGAMTVGVTCGNGSRASLAEAGADALIDDFAALAPLLLQGGEVRTMWLNDKERGGSRKSVGIIRKQSLPETW